MIYGIGCDLCVIARIEKALSSPHAAAFARRVYGEAEREALRLGEALPAGRGGARRAASAAAGFAAKEAFLKAASTGLGGEFALSEIEAVRLPSGAPEYRLSGKAAEWLAANRLTAHLSLSHEAGLAMAFCVLETEN